MKRPHASPAFSRFTRSEESRLEHPRLSLPPRPPPPPRLSGEKLTTRGQRAPYSLSHDYTPRPVLSSKACTALTQVTEGEGSQMTTGAAGWAQPPRPGRGSPGLSQRRSAGSYADSDSVVRARAPCAVQPGLAPAGLRYQHATESEIKL